MSRGIDWGQHPMGVSPVTGQPVYPNRDSKTGIRYGVIPSHATSWWDDEAEAEYEPCQECADPEKCECELSASAWVVDKDGLHAFTGGEGGDIFVTLSPYFTRASFCSPCAPGACYLTQPCEDGERAYCLGHEWFEDATPYPVYRVDTGEEVPRERG